MSSFPHTSNPSSQVTPNYALSASFDSRIDNASFPLVNATITPHFLPNSNSFWYRFPTSTANNPKSQSFIFVDPEQRIKQPAFDHEALAKALREKDIRVEGKGGSDKGEVAEAGNLLFKFIHPTAGCAVVRFRAGGKGWEWRDSTGDSGKGQQDNDEGEEGGDNIVDSREDAGNAGGKAGILVEYQGLLEDVKQLQPLQRQQDAEERPHSKSSSGDSSVRFVNKTDVIMDLLWVDEDGNEIFYSELAACERPKKGGEGEGNDGEGDDSQKAEDGEVAVIGRERSVGGSVEMKPGEKTMETYGSHMWIARRAKTELNLGDGNEERQDGAEKSNGDALQENTANRGRGVLARFVAEEGECDAVIEESMLEKEEFEEERPKEGDIFVKEHNVWLQNSDGTATALSHKGSKVKPFDGNRVYKSPKSSFAIVWQYTPEQKHSLHD